MLNKVQQDNRISVINNIEEQKNTMFPKFLGGGSMGMGKCTLGMGPDHPQILGKFRGTGSRQ